MTSTPDLKREYCDTRCGEFKCSYGLNNTGKPCDLLVEYLKDQLGCD